MDWSLAVLLTERLFHAQKERGKIRSVNPRTRTFQKQKGKDAKGHGQRGQKAIALLYDW